MVEYCYTTAMFRATRNLVLATLVLYGSVTSQAQESEKISAKLGVLMLYDQDFNHHIIDTQRFQQGSKRGADDYLAALLKAVELRFVGIKDFFMKLTLINAYNRRDLVVPAGHEYHNALDGEKTMEKLELDLEKYPGYYTEADIVVFVTGQEVITKVRGNEWLGVAKKAEVCKKKVALVSDDGKTFKGTDSLALQIALLLNASRDGLDNPCNASEYLLLYSMYGGFHSKLSVCSQQDMLSFLRETKNGCWNDDVQDLYGGVYPAEYHNITGYDICSAYHRHNTNVVTCKYQYHSAPKRNVTCGVQCCDYLRDRSNHLLYVQTAADGTECGTGKVCINRECVDLSTPSSALE